ncbi:MAG: hypothetical protein HJJLKODD_01791 [Phycisphaerae bacterium]|nr:hypothetical protein [Phycisphaerae bacterium]
MLAEHDVVTVKNDIPEQNLRAGDVGAVVHCYNNRAVYEVELVDAHGLSRGVVTLREDQLLRLNLVSLVA